MDTLRKDLLFALRTLRRSPGFALTAILTIALGIGATTAIFSAVNGVLLRPLPYDDPERLVLVWGDMRNRGVTDFPFPPADFADLQTQGTLFQDLAAVATFRQPLAGDEGEPEQVRSAGVTTNIFSLLGTRVVLGRDFEAADGIPVQPPQQQPGAQLAVPDAPPPPASVILSHEFWSRRYGADSAILGRVINLGGGEQRVIGVLEPGVELHFPPEVNIERTPDTWTAFQIDFPAGSRINVFLRVIGRLKPGVSLAAAQQQADGIAAQLREQFPIKQTAGLYLRLEPIQRDLVAGVRPALLALMGAVTFVLLIACANVANLILVRLSLRERELAVRAALGAGQGQLIRQMLTESLVIAGAGALVGLGLAWAGIRVLIALAPATLPRTGVIALDPVVLGFSALAAIVAAALFGVVPALRAARPDLMHTLRVSGRSNALGAGAIVRNGVVMTEVALSFILLIGCGLMLRSFIELQRSDPGYDPNGVLTVVIQNPRLENAEARRAFVQDVRARLGALPGVRGVTAAGPLPLDGGPGNIRWGTEEALTDPAAFQQADVHTVLPGYFETMRTRLLAGRDYTEADNQAAGNVVIIDRLLAAKAFPTGNAVGGRLLIRARTNEAEWHEVIGVVEHQRNVSPAIDSDEAVFFVDGYFGHGAAGRWAIRTTGDPAAMGPAVRAEIARINPLIPAAELQPMSVFVDRAMAPTRFALALIAAFAAIAAVLAGVGLYGVLSTAVRQRTAEIGVRMVFGAPTTSIFQLVIGQGLKLSLIGVGLGLVGAFALTRVMRSMLIGVTPTDPVTFITIAGVFLAIAGAACWLPARRAAGLDPAAAIREE